MTQKMIHAAVLAVMKDIASTGIAKSQRNQQQGYNFRGIDAAMNELSPLLVKHGITVTPKYSDLTVTERAKDGGKATRFCTLKGTFEFEAPDGSSFTSEIYGEAMDSGDKAVVKAQSVAFRTALFQEFVVPTMAMDPEDGGSGEDSSLVQSWVDYVNGTKGTPGYQAALKEARAAFDGARDIEGLKAFNKAVGSAP
ncbi:ERF family protein [Delftia tsuruhatensis]|uniref:ERF family protein n=1 Tax=Delftia tsuruhatensis TaxID=180282 RepID=UPI0020293278|nr:ERF family protein [Delftia tsuruhatensis]